MNTQKRKTASAGTLAADGSSNAATPALIPTIANLRPNSKKRRPRRSFANRLAAYEAEKQVLTSRNLPPEQYERALRQIARSCGV